MVSLEMRGRPSVSSNRPPSQVLEDDDVVVEAESGETQCDG